MWGRLTNLSFDKKMESAAFRPSGFDYLRITLALAVVLSHIPVTCYGPTADGLAWNGPIGPFQILVLPMFFSLSGFLVAGSMKRCKTLFHFLGLRFLRIYPALTVEVVLSALLIGPLATDRPLASYFSDHVFWRYMFNVTGDISYRLPGVFTNNPLPDLVNPQLWTVPWELVCYISISVLILLGLKKRDYLAPLSILLLALFCIFVAPSHATKDALTQVGPIRGPTLILYFLTGVSLFLYGKKIPWHTGLGLLSAITAFLFIKYAPFGQFLALLPASYLTVYLGLCNPRRLLFICIADCSYGVYLYGFVIQQSVAFFLPSARLWYINILIIIPAVVLVGMTSWHLIEKPALKLKPQLKNLEAKWNALHERIFGHLKRN